MRVGIGYDCHPFDPSRRLVLGGVEFPDHPGLAGHSDGDAVAHSVVDALLGAAGLGSIGEHFPDTDPALRGADSIHLLARVARLLEEHGFRPVNVDVTVIAESPRIAPHAEAMSARLAGALGIPGRALSVKGTRNEGMGWIGRGEGLAAIAVALLEETGRPTVEPESG